MNAADRATLRYMCDPDVAYKQANTKDDIPLDRKDIEFYKERIVDITEHMLDDGSTDDLMKSQFNDYVKACISYLRMEDLNDAYQEKYASEATDSSQSTSPQVIELLATDEINSANSLLINQYRKPKSLKDFVIVTNKPPPTPFPHEEHFDAHDSRHKNKRLSKKDNVDIIYGKKKEGNTANVKETSKKNRERSKEKNKKTTKEEKKQQKKSGGKPQKENA